MDPKWIDGNTLYIYPYMDLGGLLGLFIFFICQFQIHSKSFKFIRRIKMPVHWQNKAKIGTCNR
jgi:hypothetical protein